jgi:sensor histidine kinase YesM
LTNTTHIIGKSHKMKFEYYQGSRALFVFLCIGLILLFSNSLQAECPQKLLEYNENHSRLFDINLDKYLIEKASCMSLQDIVNNRQIINCDPCSFYLDVKMSQDLDLSLNIKGIKWCQLKSDHVIDVLHRNEKRSLYQVPQKQNKTVHYTLDLFTNDISQTEVSALSDDRITREKFMLDSNLNQMWNAMAYAFLGALFIVFLINMVSFYFNKRNEILWYGIYALSLFSYFMLKNILMFNRDSSTLDLIELCLQPVFLIAYTMFVKTFTESKEKFPFMDKVLNWFIYMLTLALIIIFITGLLQWDIIKQATWYIYRLISIFYAIGIIVYYYRRRNEILNFIISGSSALLIGSTLAMFFSIGQIYVGPIAPIHWMMIGIMIELTIFSGGLGFRMWLNNQEKLQFQAALISEMEKTKELSQIREEELQEQVEKAVIRIRKEEEEKRAAKLSFKERDTELQLLRAQMNPHFIFNSLNSVKSFIIKNDPRAAGDYLSKFAHLMRMILSNSKRNTVSLTNELETLKVYITLEQMRFSESFDYSIDIDPALDTEHIEVLPLLLQPFVENAIWHGLLHKESKGTIQIALKKIGDFVQITIDDDGIGREASARIKMSGTKKQKSFGMDISKDRLQHYYGDEYKIHFEDKYEGGVAAGTKVTIVIPQTTNVYASS